MRTRGATAVLAPVALALALVASACAGPGPGGDDTASLPRCDTIPAIQADPALYRDTPIYVANEMPADAVRAWAEAKPGFEEIWIDREHHGWLTLAFSRDAGARQAELPA